MSSVSRKPRARRPVLERFWEKVEIYPAPACWNWRGQINRDGYAIFPLAAGKPQRVARFIIEITTTEPIPEGMQVDHLCRNRACVCPDHLEVVTPKENLSRSPHTSVGLARERTHCPQGHEYTPENTKYKKNGWGRRCRECDRLRSREYMRRRFGYRERRV